MGNRRSYSGEGFPSGAPRADAVGRWRVALPGCWARLAGWAVPGGVSHGPPGCQGLSQPCTKPCALRQGGQWGRDVPKAAEPCRAGAPGPTTSLHWDRSSKQHCWCKNNTSGGINKLFLCIRAGHAGLTQGLALRCHRGLIETSRAFRAAWGTSLGAGGWDGDGRCLCPRGAARQCCCVTGQGTAKCQVLVSPVTQAGPLELLLPRVVLLPRYN